MAQLEQQPHFRQDRGAAAPPAPIALVLKTPLLYRSCTKKLSPRRDPAQAGLHNDFGEWQAGRADVSSADGFAHQAAGEHASGEVGFHGRGPPETLAHAAFNMAKPLRWFT